MTCDCPLSFLSAENTPSSRWRQHYIVWQCERCSELYTCECFRGVMEALSKSGWEYSIPGYRVDKTAPWAKDLPPAPYQRTFEELRKAIIEGPGGSTEWTAQKDLRRVQYREGICYLCRGITPPSRYTYVMAEAIRASVSTREAENRIRDRLEIPRIGEGWVSETELYNRLRGLFPDLRIDREASPEWLGRLRFDYFFPDVAVAVEYMGEQHYRPIELFGGEEGFAKTRERDLEKHRLAGEAGVQVVEFRHDEVLTDEEVRERIASAIDARRTERESQEDRL